MSGYDFRSLSPHDFELLCVDLAAAEFGILFEAFRQGRDEGVDLRATSSEDGRIVGQAKHFVGSGFAKLKRHIEKVELPKVDRLRTDRYLLYTSVDLSKGEKDALYEILSEHCSSPEDIRGSQEINELLRQHPQIEKSHFKLWLASTAVLERVLNNAVFERAEAKLDELRNAAKVFVQHSGYEAALSLLETDGVCIISGEPGIGKTTLADILLLTSVDAGYQPVVLSSDASEADALMGNDVKLVLYYDDFLGKSDFSEKLNKNEEHRLVALIRRVRRMPNMRLIMTTREYVLRQAQAHYETLERDEHEFKRYILDLAAYSRLAKAEILYNHLYFSDLAPDTMEAVLEGDFYLQIIDHPNYSPRLVEQVIRLGVSEGLGAEEFLAFFADSLRHPTTIWGHAYRRQISDAHRALLQLLAISNAPADLDQLRTRAHDLLGGDYGLDLASIDEALRVLEGTFISITVGRTTSVDFHNPSIRDFVVGELNEYPDPLSIALRSSDVSELEVVMQLATAATIGTTSGRRNPGIASWVAENIDQVDEALATAVDRMDLWRDDRRISRMLGRRAAASPRPVSWLPAFGSRVLDAIQQRAIDKSSSGDLVNAMRGAGLDPGLVEEINRTFVAETMATADYLSDYLGVASLVDAHPESLTDEEYAAVVAELQARMDAQIDAILSSDLDYDDASNEYDVLQQLAGTFEISGDRLYEVEEYLAEHDREPDYDADRDEYRFARGNAGSAESEAATIQGMFESLRHTTD